MGVWTGNTHNLVLETFFWQEVCEGFRGEEGGHMSVSHYFPQNVPFFTSFYNCSLFLAPLPLSEFSFRGGRFRASALYSQIGIWFFSLSFTTCEPWTSYKITSLKIECIDSYERFPVLLGILNDQMFFLWMILSGWYTWLLFALRKPRTALAISSSIIGNKSFT